MYLIVFFSSNFIYSTLLYNKFFYKEKKPIQIKNQNKEDISNLKLLIGYDENEKQDIILPESGLYQNFLITGTIGSGKTSSAMYPFTNQLLKYNAINSQNKISMLILDVKGNYYEQVKKYVEKYNLNEDLIVIELNSNIKYNPLDKPNLKPTVLANRLRTILELFSENNSESYWLDKAEQVLQESIKLCRIYNNGYVTFQEIHKLITIDGYYKEKISIIKDMFLNSELNQEQVFELNSALEFFQKEFTNLDSRTLAILKSEITRITNTFVSDYSVLKTFCPKKEELTFKGFGEVIEKGKIVVLNMNIAEYKNLSKIIATYLKLDFQTEVLSRLSNPKTIRQSAFICDEYHEYATITDADFLSQSREAKCINIIATQSYSSIKNALKDTDSSKVLLQNIINKLWFRTDDIFTIEEIQKQIGKEDKTRISTTISENSKETKFNLFTNSLMSTNSGISESYNKYTQNDYIYDTNFFTQFLETFQCLAFILNGLKIEKPRKIQMIPYYEKK